MLETLLVCLFIPLVMSLALGILLAMSKFELKTLNQDDLFKVQIRQLLSRSTILECEDNLKFTRLEKNFELFLDEGRIVKKPGFEILLLNVDALDFYTINQNCYIAYDKGGEEIIELKIQD